MNTRALVRGSLILLIGLNFVNVANYLFNLLMGRMLGPEDYGLLISLFALIYIIGVPSATIATVAMKFTAEYRAQGKQEKINPLLRYLSKRIALLALTAFLIIAFASPLIADFIHAPSIWPIILIGLSLFTLFLIPINRGILQGLQRFGAYAVNSNIDPILKILLGILLVWLGWRVDGALIAMIAAALIAYLISFFHLKEFLRPSSQNIDTTKIKNYSFSSLIALLLLALYINIDVILVKHYFSAQEAGYYGALATLGKIILFASTPIVGAMFPIIAERNEQNKGHWRVLFAALTMVLAISVLILIIYFFAPGLAIKYLFGTQYLAAVPYLGWFGLAILLYSLVNAMVNYYLSVHSLKFIPFLLITAILEILLMVFYHDNFMEIIKILIATTGATLAGLLAMYGWERKERIGQMRLIRLIGILKRQ